MTEGYIKFTKEMKKTHTILVPNMLPTHFRLIIQVLRNYGYKAAGVSSSFMFSDASKARRKIPF